MKTFKDEILFELERLEGKTGEDLLAILKKIKAYDYDGSLYQSVISKKYDPNWDDYKFFINALYDKYLNKTFEILEKENDSFLREEIRKFALGFTIIKDNLYIILARLADDESFLILWEESKKVLETETDYPVIATPIFCFLKLYGIEKYRERIRDFLLNSFEYSRKYALKNRKYDYLGDNLNSDIYLVISQGILSLNQEDREEFCDLVLSAYRFATERKRKYSMYQVSGYLAIYLTAFSRKIESKIFDKSIATIGKNYLENKFVFQTRYTKWYLERNGSEALEFLRNCECYDQLGYIAALLADLDYKNAKHILQEKKKKVQDMIVIEIFLEAIARLESQTSMPESQNRMIWMFESVSATQRTLGAGSDNVFLKRAQEKTNVEDWLQEADQE
ncbi:hypothetical protein LEP1GSC132_4113 [Leptospira kirschneri str. 200803703]|uniref:Uncharacterized protein n=1 Tax=Leptospira kirschneri str. 200802841 TaxID=1193047 RepID=A0A828Y1N5_9LEPT|nr:hypothetical protein [Leptospira kirschneri]EKO51379.1 hypothetical protein LEP1GSC131_1989 [Leptospira kirschneri str. 200802841]EMO68924.1 hypothetical protein LEP1GSC132_4113 [Leptospira kirschneri str. 200803703]